MIGKACKHVAVCRLLCDFVWHSFWFHTPALSSTVAPACTSLAFFYSQNSWRCDSSFPGWRNVSPLGPTDGMGWGLGWGLGLFVMDVLRGKEGRKRDGWPPPHSSNPWIPWLKITASWADMLIHAYIRANGGSWWIKSQTERQTPLSSRCLCSEIIFQGLYSHYQEVVLGRTSYITDITEGFV